MIDDSAISISEEALQGELAILLEEVDRAEQQLEQVRQRHEAAMAAEHEAGVRLREAEVVFWPLMQATRINEGHILAIGDSVWRMQYPAAAQAWGEVQGCKEACQRASALTMQEHTAMRYIEKQRLPALRTAARDKEAELEAFRSEQAVAIATREVTLKDNLDRFRRRLRGEKA